MLGLHPWEFDRYTLRDFTLAYRGRKSVFKMQCDNLRANSWYTAGLSRQDRLPQFDYWMGYCTYDDKWMADYKAEQAEIAAEWKQKMAEMTPEQLDRLYGR